MRFMLIITLFLVACWGDSAYILEGTVVAVDGSRVTVDHEEIPGFMQAMTMPFDVRDDVALTPGDRIVARLMVEEDGSYLARVRVTGKGAVPTQRLGPVPVRPTEALPSIAVATPEGPIEVGLGQGAPTVLTFAYTTCPMPEFCPAVVTRLQGLQPRLPQGARIVVVTLDPTHDTLPVLRDFASSVGAKADTWRWGRVEAEALPTLAMHAGLSVREEGDQILHSLRMLVLSADGRLIERYDDTNWELERVVSQLATGGPAAPPNTSGTLTPAQK
jgi:protein SCO1/2